MSAEKQYLGIELGSTRIKAVLLGPDYTPIAGGSHTWENRYENGYWTYDLEKVHTGLQACFADLSSDFLKLYGTRLEKVDAIGVSGMMHGYLPFDAEGNLLNSNVGMISEVQLEGMLLRMTEGTK